MKHITLINEELKRKILNFLYEDELFNVFLINFIENQIEDIGELYIEETDGNIDSILHIKFDGNSYFTSFLFIFKTPLTMPINDLKITPSISFFTVFNCFLTSICCGQ